MNCKDFRDIASKRGEKVGQWKKMQSEVEVADKVAGQTWLKTRWRQSKEEKKKLVKGVLSFLHMLLCAFFKWS